MFSLSQPQPNDDSLTRLFIMSQPEIPAVRCRTSSSLRKLNASRPQQKNAIHSIEIKIAMEHQHSPTDIRARHVSFSVFSYFSSFIGCYESLKMWQQLALFSDNCSTRRGKKKKKKKETWPLTRRRDGQRVFLPITNLFVSLSSSRANSDLIKGRSKNLTPPRSIKRKIQNII